jgi:hypothetical protein
MDAYSAQWTGFQRYSAVAAAGTGARGSGICFYPVLVTLMTISRVRLYSRPGCHLCEVVEELLQELLGECPFDLEQIDITTDMDLFERYRYEIPVVAVEGGAFVAGRITRDDLRRVLRLGPPRPSLLALDVEPAAGSPTSNHQN